MADKRPDREWDLNKETKHSGKTTGLLEDLGSAFVKAIRICQANEVTQSRRYFMENGQYSDTVIANPKYYKKGDLRQRGMLNSKSESSNRQHTELPQLGENDAVHIYDGQQQSQTAVVL